MLPQLPVQKQMRKTQVLQLRGLDLSDNHYEGSMSDCKNITSDRFPYFSTRKGRERIDTYSNVSALTSWDGLVVVCGTKLYYKGVEIQGSLTSGEKQFACINTKIVIMPDKKYLDMRTNELVDMAVAIDITNSVTTVAPGETDITQTMTIAATAQNVQTYVTQFSKLKTGDVVRITLGSDVFDLSFESARASGNNCVVTFAVGASGNFSSKTYSSGTRSVQRRIPDMDYICESNNRIWGCSSDAQTIYACAEGDPTNFYDYSGESTDSWTQPVGSAGKFTGCHKLGASVLFYKEDTLHKVMGDYPANYTIYSYSLDGVKDGCAKSMQVVNEMLMYLSRNGVCMYSGGSTNIISQALGDKKYDDGVAGTDGKYYYLSCREGTNRHLFVYNMKLNLWLREDDIRVVDFANDGGHLYALNDTDDKIYILNQGVFDEDWYIQFNPVYEMETKNRLAFAKKHYVKLVIRAEIDKGNYAVVKARCDGGRWEEVGKIVGASRDVVVKTFAINRCDKFELRLEGKGAFTLLNMDRLFTMGSDRNG